MLGKLLLVLLIALALIWYLNSNSFSLDTTPRDVQSPNFNVPTILQASSPCGTGGCNQNLHRTVPQSPQEIVRDLPQPTTFTPLEPLETDVPTLRKRSPPKRSW